MRNGMLKVAAATAAYFLIHSVLANDAVKARAADVFGSRTADALYRPFYLAQATLLLGLLVAYIRRQPGRDLYRVEGAWWWVLRGGQLAALLFLAWAALCVGLAYFLGYPGLVSLLQGADVPRMPSGQEPSPAPDGTMSTAGPLGWMRHPLNFALLPLFWLQPRLTTRLLAFNVVMTLYTFLGSLHEEVHMLRFHGDAYRDYLARVPFLPTP